MLPPNLSGTATTNQHGSSLELLHPSRVGHTIFRMQVTEGCEGSIYRKYDTPKAIYGMEVNPRP